MVTFSANAKRETILIEPYVRIYHTPKKDFLLFEREYEMYTRWLDAIGANFTFTFWYWPLNLGFMSRNILAIFFVVFFVPGYGQVQVHQVSNLKLRRTAWSVWPDQ